MPVALLPDSCVLISEWYIVVEGRCSSLFPSTEITGSPNITRGNVAITNEEHVFIVFYVTNYHGNVGCIRRIYIVKPYLQTTFR